MKGGSRSSLILLHSPGALPFEIDSVVCPVVEQVEHRSNLSFCYSIHPPHFGQWYDFRESFLTIAPIQILLVQTHLAAQYLAALEDSDVELRPGSVDYVEPNSSLAAARNCDCSDKYQPESSPHIQVEDSPACSFSQLRRGLSA